MSKHSKQLKKILKPLELKDIIPKGQFKNCRIEFIISLYPYDFRRDIENGHYIVSKDVLENLNKILSGKKKRLVNIPEYIENGLSIDG